MASAPWRAKHTAAEFGPDSARSLFHNFRRILEQNTAALEIMADMERAQGGEYVFDQTFLEKSAHELGRLVQRTVHCLNGLSANSHLDLYDRFQEVRDRIETILSGGGAEATGPFLSFDRAGWDAEALVGARCALLAELGQRFGLPVADGFALTPAGVQAFLEGFDLDEALAAELRRLFRRVGRQRPVAVFASPAGERDPGAEILVSEPTVEHVRAALRQTLDAWPGQGEAPAVGLRETQEASVRGLVRTLAPESGTLAVAASVPERPGEEEQYLVRRVAPFTPVRSHILAKPVDRVLPDGLKSLGGTPDGAYRGSALLPPAWLARLAGAAMAAERILGRPQEIAWSFSARGRLRLESLRPLDPPGDRGLEISGDPSLVLARGGETAQSGAAAGQVVHVAEAGTGEDFPEGAVAVARAALPRLSGVLRRAAALVTETGTAAGHLATVAREFRVPALFGLRGALELLRSGETVTVDATGRTIYAGVLEGLLSARTPGLDLDPSDPEYLLLRRMLRHILPLRLTDPSSPGFRADNCRTYHDILHFAHEQAMAELAHIQDRRPGLHAAHARRLVGSSMDIRILDTGGGLDPAAGSEVRKDQVRCEPLRAFLSGLDAPGAWSSEPAELSLRDVLGGLGQADPLAMDPSAAGNLAIVSDLSLNLSLRLGYHFSVVDAHLSDAPGQNTVYFRFVGGLAEEIRRQRRARLIRIILEGLGFLVESKGDLVFGRLKAASREDLDLVLERLGALTAFSRQMDTAMTEDADVQRLGLAFLQLGDTGGGGAA